MTAWCDGGQPSKAALQCTALALLPPPGFLARLSTPEWPMETDHVLCELGEGHEGAHAQLLWTDDANDGAVWVRWARDTAAISCLPWCAVTGERGDACSLFLAHPAGHEWQVTDPTMEAVDAYLASGGGQDG